MFLMLVISRLSIVRMMSAESRIARVVSLKKAVQSTTTRSCVARSASRTRLTPDRRDELGHLRRWRREEDADAGRVVDDERIDRLDLVAGLLELRHEVRDRLVLRVEVEQHADVAELEGAVDEDDLLAELRGRSDGHVDRDRRPSDAALGAEQARRPCPAHRSGRCRCWSPVAGVPRGSGRRPPCGSASRALGVLDLSDRRGQLVAAERLDQELAGSGQHRAAEVVRLALDGHHHDRRRRARLAPAARWPRCRPCRAC